jgi:hypothetical protein
MVRKVNQDGVAMKKFALIPRLRLHRFLFTRRPRPTASRRRPAVRQRDQSVKPADYREWIFLSSGLGMTYQPPGTAPAPPFGNVFVNPSSYRSFMQMQWLNGTTFVLEFRNSDSEASIASVRPVSDDPCQRRSYVKIRGSPTAGPTTPSWTLGRRPHL